MVSGVLGHFGRDAANLALRALTASLVPRTDVDTATIQLLGTAENRARVPMKRGIAAIITTAQVCFCTCFSSCYRILILVHGGWTEWTVWSTCSESCGGGVRQKERTCSNPKSAYGGEECSGYRLLKQRCNKFPCPGWFIHTYMYVCTVFCCVNSLLVHVVDGGWTSWSMWGMCSKPCGEGFQIRHRYCSNPRPQYGGKDCNESKVDNQTCNSQPCPGRKSTISAFMPLYISCLQSVSVDGGWSLWSPWSSCSKTCGSHGNMVHRTRQCTNPLPAHGGRICDGLRLDMKPCPTYHCCPGSIVLTYSRQKSSSKLF